MKVLIYSGVLAPSSGEKWAHSFMQCTIWQEAMRLKQRADLILNFVDLIFCISK